MQAVTTIGLDIAKSVFQVHGIDATGNVVIRRQLKRRHVLAFFQKLSPCLVGIEACASSHHWSRELKALVHTLGAQGSVIFADGARHDIPCVAPDAVLDPTGCGDAYRAALLLGIASGWDWPSIGRLGSVMGAIKIAQRGPQNHKPSRNEIIERYKKAFGSSPF